MALTEAQHRRRSYAAAYYPDSAAAAAMADGFDTTPMSPGLHSDEAAPAPMSPVLQYSAVEVQNGGMPALAPRPQPNLRDGALSPHWGGDRQGGDEFRSGGGGRGNSRQRFPFRGRGGRGRNARGGRRGFHLPALSSKPAQDVELSREPAALQEPSPAKVQQAAPAEVQQATLAQDVELSREPAALQEPTPSEVQQATLAQDVELQQEPTALQEPAPAKVQQATLAQDVELSREPAALQEAAPAKVQQATLADVQKAAPATMATPDQHHSFWCDICRVSCYSLINFEEHKNGKRHQKTKLRLEQFEAHQKLVAGVQELMPQVALGEANRDARVSIPSLSEALPKEATSKEGPPKKLIVETNNGSKGNTQELMPQMAVVEANRDAQVSIHSLSDELPKEATSKDVPPKKLIVETNKGRKGIKRKKPSEPVRVCTLCNAMCDTIPMFEKHLGGKKHMARIKRLKGPDMEYGRVPVPIFSDQPDVGTTEAAEAFFFGLARRDMLLQQGNGYDGMVTEISLHQQAVESVQAKDELLEPLAKP